MLTRFFVLRKFNMAFMSLPATSVLQRVTKFTLFGRVFCVLDQFGLHCKRLTPLSCEQSLHIGLDLTRVFLRGSEYRHSRKLTK